MCLSKALLVYENGREDLIADYVSRVRTNGNQVELFDIMGGHKRVDGRLSEIDLEKNTLKILTIAAAEHEA